jgi:hypothetical protein
VKGQPRPPLRHHDHGAFVVSVDRDAAQVTLEESPTGAAGGASLTPAPGVELVFDRADGRLAQVIVDAGEPGGPVVPGDPAVAYLGQVLGGRVAEAVRQAPLGVIRRVTRPAQPAAIAALSRLARLDAARLTSPVPSSPLWAAEAAELARRAGWTERAGGCERETTDVAAGLDIMRRGASAQAVAPAAGRPGGWLDPGMVPAGIFRYGLTPESDLDIWVRGGARPLVIVEAMLAPGAGPDVLATCRARLVDSDARRVVAASPFRASALSGLRVQAGLPAPAGLSALWVEVVDDDRRPVRSTRLRRMRRALRWADAALRAGSRPAGLAPGLADEQWAWLAALAWERCRADWAAAGDTVRASLAAGLARPPVRWQCPFLAESACDPAVAR